VPKLITKEDLLAKVVIDEATGCWVWQGQMNRNGCGRMYAGGGKRLMSHRLMYELTIGPIPTGLLIDHKCRVRACCNPDHLEPVTHAENIHRGEAKLFTKKVIP
jgi:hypothetical protein